MRGQAGTRTSCPRCSNRSSQPSQLRGVSQRPWMRTMGKVMLLLLGGPEVRDTPGGGGAAWRGASGGVQGLTQDGDRLRDRGACGVRLAERVEHHEVVRDAVVADGG